MIHDFAVSKHDGGDGVAWLRVRGEIDRDVSEAVTTIIANAARQEGVEELVIDLTEVRFLAAAGIRALVEGRAGALRHGLAYRVVNARGVVRAVLEAAGLIELLRMGPLPRRPVRLGLS